MQDKVFLCITFMLMWRNVAKAKNQYKGQESLQYVHTLKCDCKPITGFGEGGGTCHLLQQLWSEQSRLLTYLKTGHTFVCLTMCEHSPSFIMQQFTATH